MECRELMNVQLKTISSLSTVRDAARLMRDQSLGFLPVCEAGSDRLLGVVTDRDLAIRVCAEDLRAAETNVGAILSPDPIVCQEDDNISFAEEMMKQFGKSRLVVVNASGHAVGVLSLADILRGDKPRRALETVRAVLEREDAGPQIIDESIVLTPSAPGEDGPSAVATPGAQEIYEHSGSASDRASVIAGGDASLRNMKEFPG